MSVKTLDIKNEYRSLLYNMAREFYIPLLSQSINYKRSVGYFSSTVLGQIVDGISCLAKNGGSIQIVASPYLSEKDIAAIKKGYEIREIIHSALVRELQKPHNGYEEKRLNLLANLIADNILDIKIAFITDSSSMGMYHEKMGIFTDAEGNTVAFSGSMNESENALISNYEVIDVWCSWKSTEQKEKAFAKSSAFSSIWNNTEPNIQIIEFPELKQEILDRYKKVKISDYSKIEAEIEEGESISQIKSWIQKPDTLKFFDYQLQAIQEWKAQNYCGIFDMATGTGKTLTALGALEMLSHDTNDNIGIFVVCPYQHLVDQWLKDINNFGVSPLVCYSAYNWKKKFQRLVSDFSYGAIKHFCVITTNSTFGLPYFQNEVDKLKGNICLIVDEAHNFGARKQLSCMKPLFKYRLALSATLERRYDEYGTQALIDFFGKKCICYSLERAIQDGKLTPYYYYPIPVYFEAAELDEYNELTEKIVNILRKSKEDVMPRSAELLLIKRARLIAAARNKLPALYNIIKEKYTIDNQMLVYCGATTVVNSSYKEDVIEPEEKRQIEIVINMLGNDLGMRVSKFTSEEDSKERQLIKQDFADGKMLQALVAIRCLDEGMNIPGIKTAFILASSTNPKEYIQRRGRVLRTAPGKQFATIYDFITLPRNIDESLARCEFLNSEYSLLKRELERMQDFAKLAENTSEFTKLSDKITEYYQLYYPGGDDYGF